MCTQSSLLPKNLDVLTNELIKVNIPINNIIITPGDHILIALGLQFEPAVVDALLPILYYQVKLNIAVIPVDFAAVVSADGTFDSGFSGGACGITCACDPCDPFACNPFAVLIKSDVF